MITRKCSCGSNSFEMEQTFSRKSLWCQKCGLGTSVYRNKQNLYENKTEFSIESLDAKWNNHKGIYQMWNQVALKRFKDTKK